MRDFIPGMELPLRILLVTPVLLLAFLGIVIWVYRRGAKKKYEKFAELPLDDESKAPLRGDNNPPPRRGNGE